ncbi:homeobox protein PKNOX2-like [Clavelina lepadiformis]|uniref:Homeobox domain-containing protein n=1 Tax=Clavelina lepadiformis TaxID=159417 RepID=A0ABP0GNQ0_CLALP
MSQHHYQADGHSQEVLKNSSENLSNSSLDETSQVEADKQLIKSHPLFVLLELLFEKCERATRGEESPTSSLYDEDIQEFVRRHEASMSPIFIDNPEIDNLMIKAIQVLRIHLLELEKVNELCKDFCQRYITCLKGKMHSENLLRSDSGYFSDPTSQHNTLHNNNANQCLANTPNANVTVNQQGEIIMQSGMYQQSVAPEGQMSHENSIDGSTPLSQVGVSPPPSQNVPGMSSGHIYHMPHSQLNPAHDDLNNRKTKRGILPKHATEILRSWLFSHIVHPYPTEDEKRSLANQTCLTLLQVNNWFINARRRILQPMLDASNHDAAGASTNKSKKSKMQVNRSTDRFWPNTITSGGANGAQLNDEDIVPGDGAQDIAPSRASCAQESHQNSIPQFPEGYHGNSPDDIHPNSPNRLHHYPPNDVTMTSCAPVPLSMVNN